MVIGVEGINISACAYIDAEMTVPQFPDQASAVPHGRLRKAPENFIDRAGIQTVFAEGRKGRRDFIRGAFAAALAGTAAAQAGAQANPVPAEGATPTS
jgi:sulfane dehydrogenase subunit SoxC